MAATGAAVSLSQATLPIFKTDIILISGSMGSGGEGVEWLVQLQPNKLV